MKHEYFIQIRKDINSAESMFVGPFVNRSEALGEIYKEGQTNIVLNELEFKEGETFIGKIMGKTEARKLGLRSPMLGNKGKSNLLRNIPSVQEWGEIEKVGVIKYRTHKRVDNLKKEVIVLSKYPNVADWVKKQGFEVRAIERVYSPKDIAGQVVVGVLPYRIARFAKMIGVIDMPNLTFEQRGKTLSVTEMDDARASIKWYKVIEQKGIG